VPALEEREAQGELWAVSADHTIIG
jgi:hypothetical protein